MYTEKTYFDSLIALAEPVSVEVQDQLMRLPKYLHLSRAMPDRFVELVTSLVAARSALMQFEQMAKVIIESDDGEDAHEPL